MSGHERLYIKGYVDLLQMKECLIELIPVMLMPDDFRAFSKIKIDNHAFNKENLPSHFKVILHAHTLVLS